MDYGSLQPFFFEKNNWGFALAIRDCVEHEKCQGDFVFVGAIVLRLWGSGRYW